MSVWVLITYMLNPQAVQQQARTDAKSGIADEFVYKCVERKVTGS